MDIGIVFPHVEMGTDRAVLRDWVQTAEGLGFSHVLLNDHVIGAVHEGRDPPLTGPYNESDIFHEPLTLAAFYSGITTKIGFVTGVLVLPQRQTVLVAKQTTQIAVLSGNRFRLGIGVGWNYVEYEALGQDFHTRGKRQEEQVEVLRALWTTPILDYTGQWHRVTRGGIQPRPQFTIPIWFGGFGKPAFERAARIGDGFLFTRLLESHDGGRVRSEPIQNLIDRGALLRRLVEQNGRPRESFQLEGRMNYVDGPEIWESEIDRFRQEGFERIAMQPLSAGIASPQEHIRALEVFARHAGLRPAPV